MYQFLQVKIVQSTYESTPHIFGGNGADLWAGTKKRDPGRGYGRINYMEFPNYSCNRSCLFVATHHFIRDAYGTSLIPCCDALNIFKPILYSAYVAVLHMPLTLPLRHNRPQKLANHGSWRLLPLASSMDWWHSNQVHRPHPHIKGGNACTWFGCSAHWGQDICTD